MVPSLFWTLEREKLGQFERWPGMKPVNKAEGGGVWGWLWLLRDSLVRACQTKEGKVFTPLSSAVLPATSPVGFSGFEGWQTEL